ncbi:Cytochrome P450 monooxygenase aclL [Colletotrichum gloeosporioides]|uniref:Cytochrome P450 monooxygenase aclL n=1 Tax=Colletotrichum gloeosporioides TaxID=474922 RepID=A0A8H4CBA4_COLGL|nr:Cytochrome P450 monooxygenase aclL [Colletotrichum gloeosporioides]KAF3800755.1 Cytochrome P450 monooxygenase aclL [Colletotrichum gloeosporioides]
MKLKRLLSYGFSDKAPREQERLLNTYTREFIKGLKSQGTHAVDLVKWFNFITFDIISDLTFAKSFDCLSSSEYHPWVAMIFGVTRYATWIRALSRLAPGCVEMLLSLIPRNIARERNATWAMAREKMFRRRERSPKHIDFATYLLRAEQARNLDMEDLVSNAPILVVAGSETRATLLSGAAYYTASHPIIHKRLAREIRDQFNRVDEITLARLGDLSLRIYLHANSNHPRLLPPEGATICGRFVPGGSLIGVGHYSCFRSSSNFADPDDFVPERWLSEDIKYASDRRETLQPFGTGIRSCIVKSHAYNEMRLIFAILVFEFDVELLEESSMWERQQVFTTWLKKPLMVRLHRAKVARYQAEV